MTSNSYTDRPFNPCNLTYRVDSLLEKSVFKKWIKSQLLKCTIEENSTFKAIFKSKEREVIKWDPDITRQKET